jgi:hypothetical protein
MMNPHLHAVQNQTYVPLTGRFSTPEPLHDLSVLNFLVKKTHEPADTVRMNQHSQQVTPRQLDQALEMLKLLNVPYSV